MADLSETDMTKKLVYDPSITLVSVSGIHSWSTNVEKKLRDYFFATYKDKVKLSNGLLVGAQFHMTVFIHLFGMCYLIY